MTVEQTAREGLRAWRVQGVPVDAERAPRCRDQTVEAIARAIRSGCEKRQRRQRSRAFVAGFAVAAATLVGLGGWLVRQAVVAETAKAGAPRIQPVASLVLSEVRGTVVAERAGQAQVVAVGGALPLSAGDAVSTLNDAHAYLSLPAQGKVELGSVTDLRIHESRPQAQRLELGCGHIEVNLPKDGKHRSLVVGTPDAEIAVVGTVFSVDVCRPAKGEGAVTEVRVKRGAVRVVQRGRAETLVSLGQTWASSGAVVPFDAPPCASGAYQAAPPEADSDPPREQPRRVMSTPARKGELAAQNRLYQAALDARNQSDDTRAVTLLKELVTKYPDTPLRQEAQVERLRALKRLGDYSGAARDARHYLAEHASGFARDEAQELIWGPTPTAPASEP
jgi:hypothetical protein